MKRIALAIVALLIPCPALAGTTGWMTGTVRNTTSGAPVAGASVTASSRSQIARTTTDSHGRYCFISLAPDSYIVSVERDGYLSESIPAAVFADMPKHLSPWIMPYITADFMHVRHLDAGSLVLEGAYGDVYGYDSKDFLVAPPVRSDYWMLRRLPGITFGSSTVVAY